MKCPHCGFKHLAAQPRCVRCRKPMDAVPAGGAGPDEDSSLEITLSGDEVTGSRSDLSFSLEANEASNTGVGEDSLSEISSPSMPSPQVEVQEPLDVEPELSPENSDFQVGEQSLYEESSPSPPSGRAEAPGPENSEQITSPTISDDTTVPGKPNVSGRIEEEASASDSGVESLEEMSAEQASPSGPPDQNVAESTLEALAAIIRESAGLEDSDEITDVLDAEASWSAEELPALDQVEKALVSNNSAQDTGQIYPEVRELLNKLNATSEETDESDGMEQSDASAESLEIEEPGPAPAPIEPVQAEESSVSLEIQPPIKTVQNLTEPEPKPESTMPSLSEMIREDVPETEESASTDESGLYVEASKQRRLDAFFKSDHEQESKPAIEEELSEDEVSVIEIKPMEEPESEKSQSSLLFLDDDAEVRQPAMKSRGVRGIRKINSTKIGRAGGLGLRRAGAGLFDFCVWVAMGLALFKTSGIVTGYGTIHGTAGEWALLVVMPLAIMAGILAMVYGSLFGSILGQTPGMMLFGLRMKDKDGSKPKLGRVFLKTGIFLISVLPLGLGLVLELRQNTNEGIYDKLVGIKVERL